MSVQRAYLDYLRLASWHDASALKLTSQVRRSIPKWRDGFWLQYRGWYGDDSFYGIGEQNGKRHYVWRSAGPSSSVLYALGECLEEIYCTRIDVQVTIVLPDNYDVFAVYQDMQDVKDRSVSIIDSETGSTIYIGNRTSERFARLYTKEYEENKFLRLEFEFKGKTARAIYRQIKDGKTGPTKCFQYFLKNFGLLDYIVDWFDTGTDAEMERLVIEQNSDDEKRLAWLHSLTNTVIKMGNDHNTGDSVRELLRNWQMEIDNNNKIT